MFTKSKIVCPGGCPGRGLVYATKASCYDGAPRDTPRGSYAQLHVRPPQRDPNPWTSRQARCGRLSSGLRGTGLDFQNHDDQYRACARAHCARTGAGTAGLPDQGKLIQSCQSRTCRDIRPATIIRLRRAAATRVERPWPPPR
jgi:hypothetical protein